MAVKRILISSLVGVMLSAVVLGAMSIGFAFDSKNKTSRLENIYEKSFYSLCDSVNNLETDLSKLKVARSNSESIPLIQKVHSHATTACESYASLPIDNENETDCIKFFNQVADWAHSYAQNIQDEKASEYCKQADSLYIVAKKLNDNLKQTAKDISGKKIYKTLGGGLLPKGLENIDFTLRDVSIEYPTLIYDGPFSDAKRTPKYTQNKRTYSENEAKQIVKNLLKMENVKKIGKTDSVVPTYQFEGVIDGDYAFASVSVKGGLLASFIRNGKSELDGNLDEETIGKVGALFLSKCGYSNMQPVWYNQIDDQVYVNYAPVINGVKYYPDLIKIRTDKDAQIFAIDATGYVTSHENRNFEAKISAEDVSSQVTEVSIKSIDLAVINKNLKEFLCYEVYGEKDGLDYYIYYDATDGKQIDVLRVVDTNQGRKAM